MRVRLADDSIEVLLAPWERILGLMKNLSVPLAEIGDISVVENPIREVTATGLKVGLRVPGLFYVARTIRLDRAFLVKRGVPALSFSVRNRPLQEVLVSTPGAKDLAEELRSRVRSRAGPSARRAASA